MPSDLLREGARRAIHRAEKRVLIEGADDAVLSPVRSKCTRTGAHTANSLTGGEGHVESRASRWRKPRTSVDPTSSNHVSRRDIAPGELHNGRCPDA